MNAALSMEALRVRVKELFIRAKDANTEWGKSNEDFCRKFALSSSEGKRLYRCLSDDILIRYLKELATELGHPPAQKEVFWVLREYLKVRFGKWPYALSAAGLPKSAGVGGITLARAEEMKEYHNKLLSILRETAKNLKRLPHPKDMPDEFWVLNDGRQPWNELLSEANIDQAFFRENCLFLIHDLDIKDMEMLTQLRLKAKELGRAPLRNEVDSELRERLKNRCGSWRNALFQIGLEPVNRIRPFASVRPKMDKDINAHSSRNHRYSLYDCYYRILDMDERTRKDLLMIKNIIDKNGHMPEKSEIPKDIRARLVKKCGSWANVLYQIPYL